MNRCEQKLTQRFNGERMIKRASTLSFENECTYDTFDVNVTDKHFVTRKQIPRVRQRWKGTLSIIVEMEH